MKKSKIFSVVLAMFLILTLNVGAVRAADTAKNLSGCRSGKEWYRDRFL